MNISDHAVLNETRRQFFARGARGLGSLALGSLLAETLSASTKTAVGGVPGLPHFPPKAKRAIYLHMLGAPPQMETFDYKPNMGTGSIRICRRRIRQGQRLTTMTTGQTRFPIAPSIFQVRAARQERRVGFGIAALHGQDGGRYRDHPDHAYRGDQPRARDHLFADRVHDRGQALHRVLDQLTGWAA